ncbi:MAG: 3-oxoacyl-ACP synthase III family protein, partial [Nannocystaceae bacterium]
LARERFRGDPREWPRIEKSLRVVFRLCGTQIRRWEDDPTRQRSAALAELAGRALLTQQGLGPQDIDLIVFAGVTREYLEPAVAMEVGARLGMTRVHGLDVTSACVGALEAIQVVAGLLQLHPHYRRALVVTADYTQPHINLELESHDDVEAFAAGFTISDGASAWLVSDAPLPGGCGHLEAFASLSLPQHWELCQAHLDRGFVSRTREMFAQRRHLSGKINALLGTLDWALDDVDHFVLHQPSVALVHTVLRELGAPLDKHLTTHPLYANSVTSSIALNLHELLRQRTVDHGAKLLLAGAAGGISIATMALTWNSNE